MTDPQGAERVAALARIIWTEYYASIISAQTLEYMVSTHQSKEAVLEKLAQGYRYFLAMEEGRALGYFAYVLRPAGVYLDKAYLIRDVRGRGIFSAFLRYLAPIARAAGTRRVYLSVNSENTSSVQVYRAAGFRVCDTVQNDFGAGAVFTDCVMERFFSE